MAARVLIAGVSTRALAESAARAGYDVLAVDGFADLDLVACTSGVVRARDGAGHFSAGRALSAARTLAADAATYVASFENHPDAVRALGRRLPLWGNAPAVLRRVRDPVRLARALARRGWAVPAVRTARPTPAGRIRWLVKPHASGGGHGIAPWRGTATAVDARSYFQERIAGIPGSLVFAADGRRAVAIGFSRMLVGERAFGAAPFRYCGSILTGVDDVQFTAEAAVVARAIDRAGALAEAFSLVGVNGVDFVARSGVPYPVEVNPRYTASMELVELLYGLSVFQTHARACAGELPAFDLARARAERRGAIGKAVVYARRDTVLGDTRPWLEDPTVRDVPHPGERIPRGGPICTVFARAENGAACHRALLARATRVYGAIRLEKRSHAWST
jgi:uncharacterized protein